MSRVHLTPEPLFQDMVIVVGCDHCFGWFIQVWEDPLEEPVVDRDMLSRHELIEYIELYADPDCRKVLKVRECIMLDIDPGGPQANLPIIKEKNNGH
jgi:hypothetical protein